MTINVSEAIDSDTGTIVTIVNSSGGEYVDGIYVPGVTTNNKAIVSAQQPTPKQIEFLEGSERTKDLKAFFSSFLDIVTGSDDKTATVIIHRGISYKVINVGDWDDYGWRFAIGARST